MEWHRVVSLTGVLVSTFVGLSAEAQTPPYPSRPIRILVAYPPGGGVDLAARIIGQKFTEAFGQQVIIDNRGGGGGNIAMDLTAKAQPDGYTLIMTGAGPTAINVSLYSKIPFDPVRDFAPVATVATTVYALVVSPGVEAKSVKELLALAGKTHVRVIGRRLTRTPGGRVAENDDRGGSRARALQRHRPRACGRHGRANHHDVRGCHRSWPAD